MSSLLLTSLLVAARCARCDDAASSFFGGCGTSDEEEERIGGGAAAAGRGLVACFSVVGLILFAVCAAFSSILHLFPNLSTIPSSVLLGKGQRCWNYKETATFLLSLAFQLC